MANPVDPIYLDYNATSPCDPRVIAAMLPFFGERSGNAASRHWSGRDAEIAVAAARESVASFVGAAASEMIWTSGATESNNLAIKGVIGAVGSRSTRCHLITQATEHRAVLDPVERLREAGHEVTVLPTNRMGLVDPTVLAASMRSDTKLVSIMWANNETGVIQAVGELVSVVKSANPSTVFHCDATQAVGKIPGVSVSVGVDLMSFTAHKMYGPKGCGTLYVRKARPAIAVDPIFDGGGHERGLRSGTLNVPGIVGFGAACDIAARETRSDVARIKAFRDRLWTQLSARVKGIALNADPSICLSNTLHVFLPDASADSVLLACDDIAMSAGSACTSASVEPSHVLRAMGFSEDRCHSSLRISLGRFTSQDEVDDASDRIAIAVEAIRSLHA